MTALRLATAAPLAAGPVLLRDARRAAVRHPPGAARSRRPSRRARRLGSTCFAARSQASSSSGSRSPTRTRRWRRRSTAGSCRSSRTSRSAASSCGRRFAALLGETWPLRGALLLEDEADARERLHADLDAAGRAGGSDLACRRRRPPRARAGAPARRPWRARARARPRAARERRRRPRCGSPPSSARIVLARTRHTAVRVARLASGHGRSGSGARPARADRDARRRRRTARCSCSRSCGRCWRRPRRGRVSKEVTGATTAVERLRTALARDMMRVVAVSSPTLPRCDLALGRDRAGPA